MDIHNDVRALILRYPPTAADHHQIKIDVVDGTVRVSGHVRTPINRRWLANNIPAIKGVRDVDVTHLYDEDTIRIESGRKLVNIDGIIANAKYGTVMVGGSLPEGVTIDDVVARLAEIPGVERVIPRFTNPPTIET